ncbi:hypothetical protein GJ744_004442 [Endocarpon pusillum]|uniref:Uncharacterized protein n=1 Tax=Endocarpon pusillum TaxID=364733 RepID=A0A8H7AWD4_9EURO|nr:hypothetical protein GJ744_004442 [Endocarpon pusillum]
MPPPPPPDRSKAVRDCRRRYDRRSKKNRMDAISSNSAPTPTPTPTPILAEEDRPPPVPAGLEVGIAPDVVVVDSAETRSNEEVAAALTEPDLVTGKDDTTSCE